MIDNEWLKARENFSLRTILERHWTFPRDPKLFFLLYTTKSKMKRWPLRQLQHSLEKRQLPDVGYVDMLWAHPPPLKSNLN